MGKSTRFKKHWAEIERLWPMLRASQEYVKELEAENAKFHKRLKLWEETAAKENERLFDENKILQIRLANLELVECPNCENGVINAAKEKDDG